MNKRMIAALLALAGVFVALYLALFKLGFIGTLVCAVGSCEVVQTSRWATLLGLPVASWGVVFYVGVLAVALAGLRPALAENRTISLLLVASTTIGVLFSLWLTWLELFVINAICMWCVVSAVIVTALCVVSWLDLRELGALARLRAEEVAAEAAAKLRGAGWGRGMKNTEETSLRAIRSDD